jgi:hypothetical protein
MALIPAGPLVELAKVYTMGAKKYAPYNWAKGFDFSRVYSAIQRHENRWWDGEEIDPVDGQHHRDSVAWGAFTLRHFMLNYEQYKTFDDRVLRGNVKL